MRYDDFSIEILPPRDQEYPVHVVDSPAGRGRGTFRLPFVEDEMQALSRHLDQPLRVTKAIALPERASLPDPREVGERLFQALFKGEVLRLFELSLAHVEAEADRGLRIKLCLDPSHPEPERLLSLPWELLFWRERRQFLSLGRTSPVVRFLDAPRAPTPAPLGLPLRILVVISKPPGPPPLDMERERLNIQRSWARLPNLEVSFLPEATPGSLRRQLLEKHFHVLHFLGHAAVNPSTAENFLLFENDLGGAEPLPGLVLANLLHQHSLRLVFLNACDTAVSDREQATNPFAGVAADLIRAGLPAVLAMQSRISDQAATAFSETLHRRLAEGGTVDSAVAEARMAIYLQEPKSVEWAIPVLFTRNPDARLFEPTSAPAATLGSSLEIRNQILDYSQLINDKTQGFVGRKWIFEAIDRFAREQPRGYFVLRGDPGIGKSALIAQMVKERGYVHHFNVRHEGLVRPENFLRNICAQLTASYGLEHSFRPLEVTQDSRFLSLLLNEIAAKLESGQKTFLLIDALDEADSTTLAPGANVLYLPVSVPAGVYVVVTTRRGFLDLRIGCEQQVFDIEQDSGYNLADVRAYVESQLQLAGIQDYIISQGLDSKTFAAEMVERSQGNFMYLRYVFPEIERGAYAHRSFDSIPIGLQYHYEDLWRRMRSRDEEYWFHYQLPILVAMTAFKEALSIGVIQRFSGVEDPQKIRDVLQTLEQFLYIERTRDDEGRFSKRYRLYHESFGDFIAAKGEVADERVNLKAAHSQIAEALWRDLYG